ncbi:MAG: type II toxin-antitoxin system HicB family antitoxin [SAR202 cluster bacterium]|nr:type II toxin-antitoxin system HicB family antitoxin [SAR202 cluster bacterium]
MKHQLTAVVSQEGGWYIAQCLEVDVASQGETQETALSNLKEAVELHFDNPRATVVPSVEKIEIEVSGD